MIDIFDTHAHYTDSAFDEDRYEILDRLPMEGVRYVMLSTTCIEDIPHVIKLAKKYNYIYASSGIHPEFAISTSHNYLKFVKEAAINSQKVRAIGEIGLDYHYDDYNREKQLILFEEQIIIAKELNLPIIVHSRNAMKDTINLLKKYTPKGVIHCFSGSVKIVKDIIELGLYISFTGVLTFNNAKKTLEALKIVPLDRLLLETDCPYMAPVPLRGKRCDSSMIIYTAAKAAEIKKIDVQKLLSITCKNGQKLYSI